MMEMSFKIPITPMGAVRMTRRGKFVSKAAQRYLAYKEEIKLHVAHAMQGENPIQSPCKVRVLFMMPIPSSLSQKKQQELIGQYHSKKPDIDNLIKGLFDSMNGVVWKDDNLVCAVEASKGYSPNPMICVSVSTIGE